ncbi:MULTISPECIES: aminopeptidase P family protein [unclassified Salinibacterium]|uniref:aminopeptidase P family protein n=1 Tax=unclassified Salinibacterium TaxID=2632331 RepID=UPI001E43906D|nr:MULTISPECIES: aminopeptidase P family protein [unclassified Salinibacterium]
MSPESVPMPDAHPHTAPAASVPHPDRGDPRLPHLRNATGFIEYMETGWATPDRTPDTVPGIAAATAAHRARLSPAFAGRTIVVAGGTAPVRVNDNYYGFRPDSNFFWLSGCSAEDAVLVMSPTAGGHDATLFIPAPAYPGEADFFADAAHGELWVGSAPGMPEWTAALQIETRPLSELDAALARASDIALTGSLHGANPLLRDIPVSQDLGRVLSEIRMIKDEWEIAELRGAVNHTIEGFKAVAREIPQAIEFGGERWLQGTFDRYARTVGNGTGYTTIVGSGKNAPVLHWVRCDGPVNPDAAVLLDMGVEARSLYTADVTRTLPASGTFSAAQRQAHDLVEKAHRAGLAAVGPGKIFSDFHLAALEVIATGLHDWGMLPVSVDEALSPQGQHHRRYIVCGIGHHLGLDVHDCAQSSYSAYQSGELVPGMVMAVEPGLYFHEWDMTVPPELRGLGVRIEDNVLVTPTGHEVLSEALPITADGIEGWMRAL